MLRELRPVAPDPFGRLAHGGQGRGRERHAVAAALGFQAALALAGALGPGDAGRGRAGAEAGQAGLGGSVGRNAVPARDWPPPAAAVRRLSRAIGRRGS